MSTKMSIWLCADENGREIHIYWELGERAAPNFAPMYLEVESGGKEVAIRLPKEIAQQLRDMLTPEGSWEVL